MCVWFYWGEVCEENTMVFEPGEAEKGVKSQSEPGLEWAGREERLRPALMSFLLRTWLAGSSCGEPGPGVSVATNFREQLVEVCGQLAPWSWRFAGTFSQPPQSLRNGQCVSRSQERVIGRSKNKEYEADKMGRAGKWNQNWFFFYWSQCDPFWSLFCS